MPAQESAMGVDHYEMEEILAVDELEELLPDPISDWVVVSKKRRHNIFLSHSGGQKNFVEQLCEDLERAKQSPFFDKRLHSLPKGVEFAQRIFIAAQECDLAVVVISEQYFTRSKWPMLELAAIVQAPGCKILPLFFGLSCKEFKNPNRRKRWFQVWDEWSKSDKRICVDAWKDALRELEGRNGMEYVKATGEVAFRKEIVTVVCDMMDCEIVDMEKAFDDLHPFRTRPFYTDYARTRSRSKYWTFALILIVLISVVAFVTFGALLVGYGRCPHNPKQFPSQRPESLTLVENYLDSDAKNFTWNPSSYLRSSENLMIASHSALLPNNVSANYWRPDSDDNIAWRSRLIPLGYPYGSESLRFTRLEP